MSTNFSNSVPAAPSGNQLVTFQTDGSGNMSAYVPDSSEQITPSNVDLTAQAADISATTLYTPANSGIYRISAYIVVTVVDPTSSTLPSVVISWTDADNSTVQSLTLTPTNAGNVLTTYQEAACVISADATDVITYATSGYASNVSGTMEFALHIRIEAL